MHVDVVVPDSDPSSGVRGRKVRRSYPWEEIPHPPLAGGDQVNETIRSTRQKSH